MANKFSCTECNFLNCQSQDSEFPRKCLTTAPESDDLLQVSLARYADDEQVAKIMHASAQVEGQYYGQLTRVEEIIVFAKKIGARKIGIASCAGLIRENRIFADILRANGLQAFGVLCKVGAQDKCNVGIDDQDKIQPGQYEAMCNPLMQAELCNKEKTDLNVISGLCVGHDSLFIKHSVAPVTYLIVKDRVLAHNPIGALNTSHSYYKRLTTGVRLNEEDQALALKQKR
ncbi:DUF1847 domain-containing protein [Brenneria tiliae]|uniref:DUF1847 domain-containing protein n=1 Tax=Brenneria tiliae TaxID=2914984 RepID=A0ABT0MVA0_9GAMM|nr:DUF1847 domain-containing protein [Brenneria tiliae]MCL2893778.1 DUF1847 domain-containing protein [Brenneria tiliae]MCL2899085.1 DUF1847 domain-containing protein [Brenneria tiliae]MCL2903463.1 DUF1847 domain-containing protein [Brenneria tiliae]